MVVWPGISAQAKCSSRAGCEHGLVCLDLDSNLKPRQRRGIVQARRRREWAVNWTSVNGALPTGASGRCDDLHVCARASLYCMCVWLHKQDAANRSLMPRNHLQLQESMPSEWKEKKKGRKRERACSLYPPRLSPTSHSYRVIVFRPSGSELDCWLHSFGSPAISIMNNHKDPLYTTRTRCSQYLCSVQPTRTLTLYQCYLCILTPLHRVLISSTLLLWGVFVDE